MKYALISAALNNSLPREFYWLVCITRRREHLLFKLIIEVIASDKTQGWISSGLKGRKALLRGEKSAVKARWKILTVVLSYNHRPCIVLDNFLITSVFWKRKLFFFLFHVQLITYSFSEK